MTTSYVSSDDSSIAIIGLAGRFPGAPTLQAFWHNLTQGVGSITFFSDETLAAAGTPPALLQDPKYVKAQAVLDDIDCFDARFFDYAPREAALMDPQQRLFLECAWEALEHAGYNPLAYPGPIGIYAGTSTSSYLLNNVYPQLDSSEPAGTFQAQIGNDKDFLTTRVAYKLNLKGPCFTVQTACSTSLVAVHIACQGLLHGECDLALAGGVSIKVPHRVGYLYQEGMILSPDGHCRAFDAQAQGTVRGSGAGIVVLKRLVDALTDGDSIYAIIKGSAINNDGASKAGYTAPSVTGQAAVISEAQAIAGVEAESITYIETHGTGTALGDPIEIAALTKAFRTSTQRRGFCAIGSVKTNIGHLDAAAGIAGLIKTVLALHHRMLPPSLHFTQPNPQIDFAASPFYVNTQLTKWEPDGMPRRAGVSSFGIGGTNAHVILEEAPPVERPAPSKPWQILTLSAKTSTALDALTTRLADHLMQQPDANLADVAYTLNSGRNAFPYRRMLVCQDDDEPTHALRHHQPERIFTAQVADTPSVVFMFPGQGAQFVDMGRELYQTEPVFRQQIDDCSEILKPHLGLDLRHVLYPAEQQAAEARQQLNQTAITQPALFVLEYALAQLWLAWGVQPQAMIGHSLGEYVAACLAGVICLEDALALVAARGRLMAQAPEGAMLAMPLPEQEVQDLLNPQLSLAVVNGPALCVVGGPADAVTALQEQLQQRGIECRRLNTAHAFHSALMEPILAAFLAEVQRVRLQPPRIPYVSNVTGSWITAAEATDPHYWVQHLRQTVRFSAGLDTLVQEPNRIFLEVGPGRTLTTFVKQHAQHRTERVALTSLRHPTEQMADTALLLTTLGRLWLAGVPVDWSGVYAHERRQRVPLPTYPFERQRHWIEPPARVAHTKSAIVLPAIQPEQPEAPPHHAHITTPQHAVTPRTEFEQKIAGLWQSCLGIPQVGIFDDFFALGGDSLMGVQLLSRLRATLQVDLASHSLLQAPTIAALADLIAAGNSSAKSANGSAGQHQTSPLVMIQPGSRTKPPLFLAHPVGGHVYFYREIAQRLGADQPVYGFQAQGLEGEAAPLTRVEDMAARYITALRALRPAGPYLLGGSSFGGTVAFEMAQQLQARGQTVALLALLDTPGPGQMPVPFRDDAAIHAYLEQESVKLIPTGANQAQADHLFHAFKAHMQALWDYCPQVYPGSMTFFRAQERRTKYDPPRPELPWIELAAGGIEIHIVPGDHISMHIAPHVQVLAQKLRVHLEQAQAQM